MGSIQLPKDRYLVPRNMPSHGSAVVLNVPACIDAPDSLGCFLLPLLRSDTGGGGLLAGRGPGLSAAAKPLWLGQACQGSAWW